MLELLDLRKRGERLEPTRLEIDPTVAETVAGILQRVFVEGDEVLIELCQRFDGADLTEHGIMVTDDEFDAAEAETPPELREALDALIARLRDLHARQLPQEWWEEHDGVRPRRDRPPAAIGGLLRAGRTGRLPVVRLHDGGARGGGRCR